MAYEAPPGPWRQFFALIGGMLLLLIFAPSGSSPSARVRSKKVVFNSADSGFGPEGSQGDESDRNIKGKARSTNERDGRGTQLSTTAQKPINAEQHGLDPPKWKRLTSAHTVLKDEAIGEGISAADAQQQLEGIVLHLRDTHNSAEEEGDGKKEEDVNSTKYYDRWYVLDGIPSTSNSTAFEIKVSFPIETPVDMDLVVTMWTLQAAQTQLPKDVSLSDHFPKSTVRFIRVRLSGLDPCSSLAELEPPPWASKTTTATILKSISAPKITPRTDRLVRKDISVPFSLTLDRIYWNGTITYSGIRVIVRSITLALVVAVGFVTARYYSLEPLR